MVFQNKQFFHFKTGFEIFKFLKCSTRGSLGSGRERGPLRPFLVYYCRAGAIALLPNEQQPSLVRLDSGQPLRPLGGATRGTQLKPTVHGMRDAAAPNAFF